MNSQPESGVPIKLRDTRSRIVRYLGIQQLPVTLTLRGRRIGIDDRLDHSACTENCGWTKRQNVARRATLCFISFRDDRAARLKLFDVVLENRFGQRNQPADEIGRASCRERVEQ